MVIKYKSLEELIVKIFLNILKNKIYNNECSS